jgi:hypothetical protein
MNIRRLMPDDERTHKCNARVIKVLDRLLRFYSAYHQSAPPLDQDD